MIVLNDLFRNELATVDCTIKEQQLDSERGCQWQGELYKPFQINFCNTECFTIVLLSLLLQPDNFSLKPDIDKIVDVFAKKPPCS